MLAFPNCKINLGLNITGKREDGFHDIETVFFPVPVYDVLEIITADDQVTRFNNTGIQAGDPESNLCLKAYYLVKKNFPGLPQIQMHLHKEILIGAGLGGGSADAAFTLLLLNKKFGLHLSEQQLLEYALQLGSDCPFFLVNKPCLASGRGEVLNPVNVSLSGYKMIIVNPGIHINTQETYQEIIPAVRKNRIKDIIQQPVSTWKKELVNDFEKIVFPKYPAIKAIREEMYAHHALYSAMTGTGSTVYGIFKATEGTDYLPAKDCFHLSLSF